MSNKCYKPHIFSLCALFVLGNSAIILPCFFADNPFLTFAVTAVFSMLFMWIATVIIKFALKNKKAFCIIKVILCTTAIYGVLTTLCDFIRFVSQVQLPQTNVVFIAIVSVIMVCVFALGTDTAFLKYSLLFTAISGICVILMFVGGIKHFDFSQFGLSLCKSAACTDFTKIFFKYFSPIILPTVFVLQNSKFADTKTAIGGTAVGFAVLGVCLVQSVLTLGRADVSFPYIKAVGVISSGSLFSRIDGLAYFLFFATAMIKASLCLKTAILLVKTFNNKKQPKS